MCGESCDCLRVFVPTCTVNNKSVTRVLSGACVLSCLCAWAEDST